MEKGDLVTHKRSRMLVRQHDSIEKRNNLNVNEFQYIYIYLTNH